MNRLQLFRIHPLLIVIFLGIFLYGDIALYAMLLTSLLVHEMGHLVAAHFSGVRVKCCTLLPYGAEMTFVKGEQIEPRQLLVIAVAGPFTTAIFAIICAYLPELYSKTLLHIQWYLFFFNMLPLWSLDGGRVVYAVILLFFPSKRVYEYFVTFSFCVVTILFIYASLNVVSVMSLFVFSTFLWIQIWKEWKYRKYRGAFEKYVLQRLT